MNRAETKPAKDPVCGACKAELPISGPVVSATDITLEKMISKSPLPVVVDVWAPWCGPCKAFAPTFEEMADKYAGQAVFMKLNSDVHPKVSQKFGIRGIPTVLLFKDGVESNRQAGALTREQFGHWLAQGIK